MNRAEARAFITQMTPDTAKQVLGQVVDAWQGPVGDGTVIIAAYEMICGATAEGDKDAPTLSAVPSALSELLNTQGDSKAEVSGD